MANKHGHILSCIATNQETAVVINIDGEIVDVIPLDFDPTSPQPVLDKFLKDTGKEHPGCAVSVLLKKSMSEAELQKTIDESVEALKLNKAGKLKPGANIIK
jgi:hypothetical protein